MVKRGVGTQQEGCQGIVEQTCKREDGSEQEVMGEKEEVNRRPVRVLMLPGGLVIDGDENEHREYQHSRGV